MSSTQVTSRLMTDTEKRRYNRTEYNQCAAMNVLRATGLPYSVCIHRRPCGDHEHLYYEEEEDLLDDCF